MKYIIYARKSTEDREDRQVLSIDSQIEAIQSKFPTLEVVEIIKESKSAYKPYNRPGFQRMVELFESGKAQGCIAWHPDRLSREPMSGAMIIHLVDRGLIKDLKFASYNFDNSPEGKMMLGLSLSQSKYFSEKLSIDVKRGMVKKCKLGHMPTRPPVGYMPDHMAEKGEKRALVDPERFDLVRKMWDLMLTGQYSIPKIMKSANRIGLTHRPTKRSPTVPISKNGFHKMFSNVFYTGQFIWDGEMYQGNHVPMITMAEFEKVQEIIGRRHVPRPQKYESLTSGLIQCTCDSAIMVDLRKKKIKRTNSIEIYKYARCTRQKKTGGCNEPITPLHEVEKQIVDYLNRIKVSPNLHQWAINQLNKVNENEIGSRETEKKAIIKAHENCQNRLDNLLRLKISPENSNGELLNNEEFKAQKQSIIKEREGFAQRISQFDARADKWMIMMADAFNTASCATKTFEHGSVQEKKVLLAKIGANFILKNKKLTIEAKNPYITFAKYLPMSHQLERQRGKLKESQYKAKKAVSEQLETLWSSLMDEVRTTFHKNQEGFGTLSKVHSSLSLDQVKV